MNTSSIIVCGYSTLPTKGGIEQVLRSLKLTFLTTVWAQLTFPYMKALWIWLHNAGKNRYRGLSRYKIHSLHKTLSVYCCLFANKPKLTGCEKQMPKPSGFLVFWICLNVSAFHENLSKSSWHLNFKESVTVGFF